MRKVKKVNIGDYVLVTRWADKDPLDPSYVGFIFETGVDKKGDFYRVSGCDKFWRNVFKISEEEGREWMQGLKDKKASTGDKTDE